MACGYPSLVASTVQEAERKLAELGHERFTLIVIDSNILGDGGADLQLQVRYLLQTWPGRYPRLPIVFLGSALQKYAILAAHPALVSFVTTPFSPHDLMQTIQPLLPPGDPPPSMPPNPPGSPGQSPSSCFMCGPPPGASPPCGL
ncbi:hypothetical protein [Candidatus Entotheonella palauensis]|nr:hypothetical protein [Candidatus Entotheonella palauensis]